MASSRYWYWDSKTKQVLEASSHESVALLSGFGGYANFGDILQLKGTMEFHRSRSGLKPVPIIHAGSFDSEDAPELFRKWLDAEAVLFWSGHPLDLSALGCSPVGEFPKFRALQLYGGGFMNSMWGDEILNTAESLLERIRPDTYVISGQQIAPDFLDRFRSHARMSTPDLVGARDEASAKIFESEGYQAPFSFDDAAESVPALLEGVLREDELDETVLIHMNITSYTSDDDLAKRVDFMVDSMETIKAHLDSNLPGARVVFLNAYASKGSVIDTLTTIQLMGSRFPFLSYDVVHIGDVALFGNKISPKERRKLGNPKFIVTSSYHVAVMAAFIDSPVFLLSRNGYYDQKRAGLGLTYDRLDDFLTDPQHADISGSLERRRAWLERQEQVFRSAPRETPERAAASAERPEAPAVQSWKRPETIYAYQDRLVGRIQELERAQALHLSRIRELESVAPGRAGSGSLRGSLPGRLAFALRVVVLRPARRIVRAVAARLAR